jgi:Tol biopolymer transport system component
MSDSGARPRFSRFDRLVAILAVVVTAAIALLAWRGDQVGIHILTMTPAAAAEGVSTRTQVALQFDQPIASAPDAVQIVLEPPAPGALFLNGDQLRFAPASPLAPDTTYTVRLAPGLRSTQGRTLAAPVEWQFRTGSTQLVFSTAVDGVEQLFVVAPSLTPPISAAPPVTMSLTSSPDGVWDFVVAPTDGTIAFAALTPTNGSDLWQVAVGSTPAMLQACANAFCSTPAWSPDGRLLAFSQRNANEFGAAAISPPRLYLRDMVGGETAPIFADNQQLGFDARWSADGRWITYISPDRVGIGVYNLESGAGDFYPTSTGEPGVWHPAQSRFLMTELQQVGETYVVQLILVDPHTGARTNLSGEESLVEDGAPAWSPDGQWIAFRRKELAGSGRTLGKQLWLMPAPGALSNVARPLTADAEFDYGAPAWSPDGRHLAYHRFPLKGPNIVISVWVMAVASGEQWQVAAPGQRPQWLP